MSKPLSIKIFVDEKKYAIGHYYFDDGISINTNGEYLYIEFEFKTNFLKVSNKNTNYKEKKISEIIPIYDKIEIFGCEKFLKANFNEKEKDIIYKEENNSNILDLSSEKIKLNNSFEIIFTK